MLATILHYLRRFGIPSGTETEIDCRRYLIQFHRLARLHQFDLEPSDLHYIQPRLSTRIRSLTTMPLLSTTAKWQMTGIDSGITRAEG